jgi:hypothetical protein
MTTPAIWMGEKGSEQIHGAKVFSVTMAQQRNDLGDRITEWVRTNPERRVVDVVVTQSSDEAFHCLSIILFWAQASAA